MIGNMRIEHSKPDKYNCVHAKIYIHNNGHISLDEYYVGELYFRNEYYERFVDILKHDQTWFTSLRTTE